MQTDIKKVVILGGGNGTAISLRALKPYTDRFELTAIVSMSDAGGSSGKLRKDLGVLPPGDMLRAVLASSPYDFDVLEKIFRTNRFSDVGKLSEHNLGNLFLALSAQHEGSMLSAISALSQAVEAKANIFPATLESSDLCVELSNGDIVIGEDNIDRPEYDRTHRITRTWLQPKPMMYDTAKDAMEKADVIILGPGSLYTSIIATVSVEGMIGAFRASRARIIYIAGNAHEMDGETGPDRLCEFVRELQQYVPKKIDIVVYGNAPLTEVQQKRYKTKRWKRLILDPEAIPEYQCVGADIEKEIGGLDPGKLGKVVYDLIFVWK